MLEGFRFPGVVNQKCGRSHLLEATIMRRRRVRNIFGLHVDYAPKEIDGGKINDGSFLLKNNGVE